MYTSVRWMNEYLDPSATAQEQGELLTQAGFPLEGSEPVNGGDVRQDFEMISNRGDCVCHVGLAREIAAMSGRMLKAPEPSPAATGPAAAKIIRVTNREPNLCPLYTARVIRGVKVGPSPTWLAERLTAIGQIPRNNIVDASNFVLFEIGQPTHVFDLAKLAGPAIVIRMVESGETLLPIGEGATETKLTRHDLVIADEKDPVAIAGVKGGAPTAVTDSTTDILIEAATFDPVAVRHTSRRLNIASDSSYRFERGVHAATVNPAADRLAELILELCGGTLCDGVVSDGAAIPRPRQVSMRPDRCRLLLGVALSDEQMIDALGRLSFEPQKADGAIRCTVPCARLDVEREIDLIEEVGRVFGHDNIPIADTIQIRVAPPQATELARRAVHDALVGLGFVETLTHSLISEPAAAPFLMPGMEALHVDDERAKAEPVLRPSVLPSLLRVRAHNLDAGVRSLKLFESAASFWRQDDSHHEQARLALLADLEREGEGLRPMRGVVERLVELLLGPAAQIEVVLDRSAPWLAPAGGEVRVGGESIGWMGVLAPQVGARFGLTDPLAAADLDLARFYDHYPPETQAHGLPQYPPVERDISAIVDEQATWLRMRLLVESLGLEALEAVEFITTFRGRQVGKGKKSVTLRLRFRAADRTLKSEAVDAQMDAVVAAFERELGAEIRKQARS
ncbi:MAG: phenylalanine--tRNA ligase subunit beta [Planctomycetota bacterium]|jgi:phenylalanyl-tRNA synthetase beta chain